MKLTLAGSSQLKFLPLARKADIDTQVDVAASEVRGRARAARPEISKDGFSARWSVLEINRNFGQSWYDSAVRAGRAGGDRRSRKAASA